MPRIKIDEDYENDPQDNRRGTRFKKKHRNPHAILDEIAIVRGLGHLGAAEAFSPSLGVSRHEREWIFTYLSSFYENRILLDVLRRVKGGKEANVYVCSAHPSLETPLLAAKLYRPRMFRNLRNDARYRDRRNVLDEKGKLVTDRGALAALAGGSSYGQKLRQISWLQHEYAALENLFSAGVPVPRPYASGENTILMEYIGDLEQPAPALVETTLSPAQARRCFEILIEAVEKMLALGVVHADLSAYNVLFWENRPVIIDFPQAINPRQNPDGWAIFSRDIERLCQHFGRYGIRHNASWLAREIWERQCQFINPLSIEELDVNPT